MNDPLEFFYHDPALARRLLVMAHWRKTPKEMAELSGDEIEVMDYGLALYERRWMEQLSDLFGTLLGASWSVDSLLADRKVEKLSVEKQFTWQLRPERKRISLPLTTALAPESMKQLKAAALAMQMADRATPSVINVPANSFFTNTEIVDLSLASKDEFLRFSGRLKGINDDG